MAMHDVIAALEAFHQQAAHIFDRVEGACGEVDNHLNALDDRLERAAARVEAARGSTRPLNVQSARLLRAPRRAQRTKRLFDSNTLASLCNAAPLPEEMTAAPSSTEAAQDIARVLRCIAAPNPFTAAAIRKDGPQSRLLPAEGRLGSCAELFLYNSAEQPYRGGPRSRGVDNLLIPDEAELRPASLLKPWLRTRPGEASLRLDEDEVDPLLEDIRFVPAPAKQVNFDLPDVLPDLTGPVADIMWRQDDQLESETQRPAWDNKDVAKMTRSRGTSRASISGTPLTHSRSNAATDVAAAALLLQSRAGGGMPSGQQPSDVTLMQSPPKPAAPPPKAAATPKESAKSAAAPLAPTKGKGKGPAAGKPPPPSAKGKGKGKKGGPPPPAQGGGPPKANSGSVAGGKAEMFASIKKSGISALRKVAPPKERSGAPVGRVL